MIARVKFDPMRRRAMDGAATVRCRPTVGALFEIERRNGLWAVSLGHCHLVPTTLTNLLWHALAVANRDIRAAYRGELPG